MSIFDSFSSQLMNVMCNVSFYLFQAAILQQTAEYIYSLEQEKTRLLAQNCQLKRLLSLSQQQNAENEDQMQDQGMPLSPLASRRKKAKMAEKASAAPSSSSSEDMKQQTVICDQPQQTTVVATPAIVPQPPPPQATQQVTVKPEQLLPTQPAPIIAGTNSATLPGGITITKQELPSKLQPTQQQPTPSISVTAQPIIHGTPSVTLTGGPSSAAAANAVAARLLKQQTPVTFLPNQPVPNRPPAAVIVTANAMTSVRGPLKQETDDIKPPTLPPTLQLPTQPSPAVKVLATGGVGSSHLPVNLATLITKAKVPAAHQPTTIAPVISNPPATVVLRPPQPPPQSVAVVTSVKQPATVALSTNPHIQVKTTTDTGSAGGPSNLDSIVAAIRHLEGDHLFSDSSNAQAKVRKQREY